MRNARSKFKNGRCAKCSGGGTITHCLTGQITCSTCKTNLGFESPEVAKQYRDSYNGTGFGTASWFARIEQERRSE